MWALILKIIGCSINILSFFSSQTAAQVALYLFSTPRKGKIVPDQMDFLDTAIQAEFKYEELPIMSYRWKGKSKKVLLAHGWESNSLRWKKLISFLQSSDHEVIAIDAPAHGSSGSKQFNALLYAEFINVVAQKLKPDVIIGHSVGGMAAVFSQFNYPQKQLKKLILLGCPAHFDGVLQRYVEMMGYNKRVHQTIKNIIYERYNHDTSYYSTAKFAQSINLDTLVIHDENDEIIPFDDAQLISSNMQNSKLISTSGFDHSLNNQTIHNYILDFINA